MSFVIEKDGKRYEVPREVEAAGGAAVKKWLAEQAAAQPKATKTPTPKET